MQAKHHFVVQKKPQKHFPYGKWKTVSNEHFSRQRGLSFRRQTGHRSQAFETSSTSVPGSLRRVYPSDLTDRRWKCRGRLGLIIGVVSHAGVDPSSVTSRRPHHRGLSDPITDLDRSIILASQPSDQALSWLGGECAALQQGRQYHSAPFCWCGRHPIGLSRLREAYYDLLHATHGCIPCSQPMLGQL